jgi:ATP-dependent Lhr-like helicase
LFSPENLGEDIVGSINSTEMAKRKFRDIACISGLVFQGFPGKVYGQQTFTIFCGIIFQCFYDYDKHNLLLRQAYDEAFYQQIEEPRLLAALQRIQLSKIILIKAESYTPLCFPIKVDSLRENMSTEELGQRIERMTAEADQKVRPVHMKSRKKNDHHL